MAFTVTELVTDTDDTDSTSYATASISPTGDRLVLCCISSRINSSGSGDPTISSVTGGGMTTWTDTGVAVTTSSTFKRKLFVYRALQSSPTSGALTVTFGEEQRACEIAVYEISGIDTGGVNGADAIGGSATDTANTQSSGATLTCAITFEDGTNSMTFSVAGGADEITDCSTDAATFAEEYDNANLDCALCVAHDNDAADTSVVTTFTTSGTADICALAIEIKPSGAAPATPKRLALMGVGQ